jgi:hypothetical protein
LRLVDGGRQAEGVERPPRKRLTDAVDGDEHHAGAALPVGKLSLLERGTGLPAYLGARRLGWEAEPEELATAVGTDDDTPAG